MAGGFLEKLRGARRFELYAAVVLAALIGLWAFKGSSAPIQAKTDLELRLESILSCVLEEGKVSVMITQQENEKITGVFIVAENIRDIGKELEIQNAVKTLLDIELEQIQISESA